MSIIASQSIKNVIITYIGFIIGAINALFLYTHILGDTYYGLVGFILSSANMLMPLMAFGIQNSLIRFYPRYKTDKERSQFLTFVLVLPLLITFPIGGVSLFYYPPIATWLSSENAIIYDYVWMVPILGLSMAYFEIFYAWVKAQFQSVFGGFIKEILVRLFVSIALILVYYELLTQIQFIYTLFLIYFGSMFIMMLYAFKVKLPDFNFSIPENIRNILAYSSIIILSGSVAILLLDIDRFMLSQYINIKNVAYYSVAIFICAVIYVPGRAMHQIIHPVTSKLIADNRWDEVSNLYKKSSKSLQVVGGLIFLCIILNIKQIYLLIPIQYSGGVNIVFIIGLSKYIDLLLGNNNSIIYNSKYYKMILFLGLMLVVISVSLNMYLIPKYHIVGAAFATLFSTTLYSWSKLLLVVKKMKISPFSINTTIGLFILITLFGVFYFWDFEFHPILNILLKSLLVVPTYLFLNYKFIVSEDINKYIDKGFVYFKRCF